MDRAAKAVRRSGVRLMSLGGGHQELNMVLSELKDVRNAARALAAAQNSAAQYMVKWACGEENRAIQDVVNQMVELNLLYTEVQAEFADQMKTFRQMFEAIHEGERHVDQARTHLTVCDQRESKVKKELKKAAKKATNEEINHMEKKLRQAERARDLAQLELSDRIRENEAVKLIRFKDGMLKLSEAYTELGKKCAIIHEAQRDIALLLPDVHEKDIDDIKYTGSGATKQYVVKAKEKIRLHNRQQHRQRRHLVASESPSLSAAHTRADQHSRSRALSLKPQTFLRPQSAANSPPVTYVRPRSNSATEFTSSTRNATVAMATSRSFVPSSSVGMVTSNFSSPSSVAMATQQVAPPVAVTSLTVTLNPPTMSPAPPTLTVAPPTFTLTPPTSANKRPAPVVPPRTIPEHISALSPAHTSSSSMRNTLASSTHTTFSPAHHSTPQQNTIAHSMTNPDFLDTSPISFSSPTQTWPRRRTRPCDNRPHSFDPGVFSPNRLLPIADRPLPPLPQPMVAVLPVPRASSGPFVAWEDGINSPSAPPDPYSIIE